MVVCVRRDQSGFVLTGNDLLKDGQAHQEWPPRRPPMFLESSLPGVFAAGDVRHGSVKRVASAVGEGSIAIHLVHDHLRGNLRGAGLKALLIGGRPGPARRLRPPSEGMEGRGPQRRVLPAAVRRISGGAESLQVSDG